MRLDVSFLSSILLQPVRLVVLLPAENVQCQPPYKTVWILHSAMSSGERTLESIGGAELCEKKGLALVAPSLGNSYYVNSEQERYADFLCEELMPLIQQNFPLSRLRNDNMVMGFSMGAFGAMHWGFARCQDFGVIAAVSGVFELPVEDHPFFSKDRFLKRLKALLNPVMRKRLYDDIGRLRPEADLERLMEQTSYKGQRIFPHVSLYCGEDDYLALPHCHRMFERLRSHHVKASLHFSPGGHDEAFWRQAADAAVTDNFFGDSHAEESM